MILELINKVLIVLFFMSLLTTLRHIYYFSQAMLGSTEEQSVKYKLTTTSLFYLCLSMAYILTTIFTGLTLK